MNTYDILLNNSDTGLLRTIEWALKDRGLEVTAVNEAAAAIRALHKHHYDVVLTDMDANPEQGFAVLKEAKSIDPETIVILLGCQDPTTFDPEGLPADVDEVVFAPCGTPKLWKRLSSCLERMELRRRDAHLQSLATEMKQLRDGAFGKMDGSATAKVSALLNSIEEMISDADDHLAASNETVDFRQDSSH